MIIHYSVVAIPKPILSEQTVNITYFNNHLEDMVKIFAFLFSPIDDQV